MVAVGGLLHDNTLASVTSCSWLYTKNLAVLRFGSSVVHRRKHWLSAYLSDWKIRVLLSVGHVPSDPSRARGP